MKFGKVLEQRLVEVDVPEEWIETAICYKSLKKCINKVVDELKLFGLEKDILKSVFKNDNGGTIIEKTSEGSYPKQPFYVEYSLTDFLNVRDKNILPRLRITFDYSGIENKDGVFVDGHNRLDQRIEPIFKSIRNSYDGGLALDHCDIFNKDMSLVKPCDDNVKCDDFYYWCNNKKVFKLKELDNKMIIVSSNDDETSTFFFSPNLYDNKHTDEMNDKKAELTIFLNSDVKFFEMLNNKLFKLEDFKKKEELKLADEVQKISDLITFVNLSLGDKKMRNVKNSDMFLWKDIFAIYLEMNIYFKSTNSTDVFKLKIDDVNSKLISFHNSIIQTGLLSRFVNKQSKIAFDKFMILNHYLFKLLEFQSLNKMGVEKILKKFDKQTCLGIKKMFSNLFFDDYSFIEGNSMAYSICCLIQTNLLTLVPQLNDYICPICASIAFKPIRLSCGHLFCVRCLVKLKVYKIFDCLICRKSDAVVLANSSNLDAETLKLMKFYFSDEIKKKIKEVNDEKYQQIFSQKKKCTLM